MKNFRNSFVLTFATVAIFFVFGLTNNLALANVSNIVGIFFTTEPKNLAVDEISGGITIQAQNASREAEKMDVSGGKMTITVSSGEISSSPTTWENLSAPLTVNSNWSGRTVYYKNSLAGTYTINATLNISGKSWSATQDITVGNNTEEGTATSTATTTTATTTATTTTVTGTSTATNTVYVYSTHYIQESLSTYTEPTNVFEVSAGRPRLSYLNSPISLTAKYKTSSDVRGKRCEYVWSFGDGSSLSGEKVEHLYKRAGDYNVVLNGACGDLKSVSRTTVKVLEPNLLISPGDDGAVEISNKGAYEINLYGWKLQSQNITYNFPLDTIVSAGKNISVPNEYLKFTASGVVTLVDPSGRVLGQVALNNLAAADLLGDRTISKEEVEKFVAVYKNITQPTSYVAVLAPVENRLPLTASSTEESVTLTAAVADAPSFGFWSKLFHPVRTIREAFYK